MHLLSAIDPHKLCGKVLKVAQFVYKLYSMPTRLSFLDQFECKNTRMFNIYTLYTAIGRYGSCRQLNAELYASQWANGAKMTSYQRRR